MRWFPQLLSRPVRGVALGNVAATRVTTTLVEATPAAERLAERLIDVEAVPRQAADDVRFAQNRTIMSDVDDDGQLAMDALDRREWPRTETRARVVAAGIAFY